MPYLVTSAFTPAKVIGDRQEAGQLAGRVDRARAEKLLAQHDPFEKLWRPGARAAPGT